MFLLVWPFWNLFGSFFGALTNPPKYPLERNIGNIKLFRPGHDQAGDIGGEFLSMRPFLYGSFSYSAAERGGKLSIAQRDTAPRAEHIQEEGEAISYGDQFRASFGLDRGQDMPTFGVVYGELRSRFCPIVSTNPNAVKRPSPWRLLCSFAAPSWCSLSRSP